MNRRILALFSILILLVTLAGTVRALPETPPEPGLALVYVALPTHDDLERFAGTGLPAYARLHGHEGDYLLAGASPDDLETLVAAGLSVRVLDADTTAASYFLVYLMPDRPTPDWDAYGRLLLDDGVQVLLRAAPEDAERLTQAGTELRQLTLDPKPLQPFAGEGVIPAAVDPDPLIQLMMDQVVSTTVYQYDGDLSGEWPVWVDGGWYTINSRYTYSGEPIEKATHYVGEHLANLGLPVEYHQWGGSTYPNVIGEIAGQVNPDDIFIICAHLDDVQGTPGADDNASGSVATMIAAEILSQYQWGCTLRFALWTGEEQGLNGSYAYAQRSYNLGENIVGVLNLDMIAWNTLYSSPDIDLHATTSIPDTQLLAQLFADVVDAYNIDLIPQIIPNGTGASDHASFWDFGYTAILGIEDGSDFNPYYHGPNDLLDNMDIGYFTKFVKASLGTFAHMSGCLIPGGIGHLHGYVTAASTGDPIEGATVTIQDNAGHSFPTTTDADGHYTRTLLAGTYTVTAEAYGFLPATATDVPVITDSLTTQNFALADAPTHIVSGTVTEEGTGLPLLAQIEFQGSPVVAWSDPVSGFYQATLAEGSYTMHVSAALHEPQTRFITVDHDQTQNFALAPLPCVLLVDDDNDSPNVRPYFTAALDNLGYDYNVFDVGGGGGNGPDIDALAGYSIIVWFSGDKWGGSAGPNGTDETALTAYLDAGGKLFLSSQDYLYDFGLTPFGQTYLGIGTYDDDTGNASTKYGVAGDPIGDGLGPYPLTYPAGFDDYGDVVNAGAGASVAFRSSAGGGNDLDIDKDGGDWQTVFFGTSWVPVYYNNAANGEEVLDRIIQWFGGCVPQAGWLNGQVTDAQSGDPLEGADVTVAPGTGAPGTRGRILASTNPNGHYTMTLPPGTYDVTASKAGYLPQTAQNVVVQDGLTTTQDFALDPLTAPVIVVTPTVLSVTLYPDQLHTDTLSIANEGDALLDFTLVETPPVDWLAENPPSGIVTPSESLAISVTFDSAGLTPGPYSTILAVINNDPTDPLVPVTVTLTVLTPCVPVHAADFGWAPPTPAMGEEVTFTGTAGGTEPIAYAWDFGDGNTAAGQVVTHTYATTGTFTVVLTASNECGFEVVSDTLEVVAEPVCQPVSIVAVTTVISGCLVDFAAELTGDAPFSYDWDFGPFGSDSTPTPTVDFVLSGTYPYTLTVLNCDGTASDSYSDDVTVDCAGECAPLTNTGFVWTPFTVTVNQPVTFTASAEGTPPITYAWLFGDGDSDSGMVVVHTYTATGTYTVTLIVHNPCDQDVVTHTLAVTSPPSEWKVYLPLVFKNSGP